jgi:tRNA/rRNA methyltransferase
VLLVAWEIRRAELESTTPEIERERVTAEAIEALLSHARRTLDVIGYLDPQNPRLILDDLRKVLSRAELDPRELNMIRGIFHRMDVWISQHGGPPTPNQARRKD